MSEDFTPTSDDDCIGRLENSDVPSEITSYIERRFDALRELEKEGDDERTGGEAMSNEKKPTIGAIAGHGMFIVFWSTVLIFWFVAVVRFVEWAI